MPNLGPAELLMILVVALVLFGPRRLPELGKTVGQALRSFRQATGSVTEELKAGLEGTARTPPLPSVIAPGASVPAVPAAVSSVVLDGAADLRVAPVAVEQTAPGERLNA